MNILKYLFDSKVSSPVRAGKVAVSAGVSAVMCSVRPGSCRLDGSSRFVTRHSNRPGNDSFAGSLKRLIKDKCAGDCSFVCRRAGVDRRSYFHLAGGGRDRVSKRIAMQFAIGLQLTLDEADRLLRSAGFAFSDREPEDIAFRFCIENRVWNLRDLNGILGGCGLTEISLPDGY